MSEIPLDSIIAVHAELSVLFSYIYWILSFIASYCSRSSRFASISSWSAISISACLDLMSVFNLFCFATRSSSFADAVFKSFLISIWSTLIFSISCFVSFNLSFALSRFSSASFWAADFAWISGTDAAFVSAPASAKTRVAAQIFL